MALPDTDADPYGGGVRARTVSVLLVVLPMVLVLAGCGDDDDGATSTTGGGPESFVTAAPDTAPASEPTTAPTTESPTTVTTPTAAPTTDTPATVAPASTPDTYPPGEDPGEQYVGLEYSGDALPDGVTWLGGAVIGEAYPEPEYGVSFFSGPDGPMFWLEEFLSYNADGTPNWRVIAVRTEPRAVLPPTEGEAPPEGWTFVNASGCTIDGEPVSGLVAGFVGDSAEETITDPVWAYQPVLDPPGFVAVDGEVECENPGYGV